MSRSTSPALLVTQENAILYVSLNRPDKHNAFDPETILSLTQIFSHIDDDIQALVLKGEGPSFSAGADLNWMKSMVNYKFEENLTDSQKLFEMFEAGSLCPCPIIGRLHGNVMGGALGLASICDVGVAEADTRFAFSEVRLGLAPAVISPFVLNKMNRSMASEWMLTGCSFSAIEAKESGLVQYVRPLGELDALIEKILHRLSQSGPEAVRATKALIHRHSQNSCSPLHMKEEVIRTIAERRVSREGQEGVKAFLEKRKA